MSPSPLKRHIPVAVGTGYEVVVGPGLLDDADCLHQPLKLPQGGSRQVLLVSGKDVPEQHRERLQASLESRRDGPVPCLVLNDSESNKTLDGLQPIFDQLADLNFDRESVLYALGGGVTSDMVGFAAACWKRGVRFVTLPTTLLAQVDAAIGGKTAVNHPKGKNLIGAFHQPSAVFIDIQTLQTLPNKHYRAAISEILKYGIVCDAGFFAWLEKHLPALLQRDPDTMLEAIASCCRIKAAVVTADEKESGQRALLNFGHTFGHALEAATGYSGKRLAHGEAVYIGMQMALRVAQRLQLLAEEDAERIARLLHDLPLRNEVALDASSPEENIDQVLELMASDKKNLAGSIRLVLPTGIGTGCLASLKELTATNEDLRAAISPGLTS